MQHVQNSEEKKENKKKHCMLNFFVCELNLMLTMRIYRHWSCESIWKCSCIAQPADKTLGIFYNYDDVSQCGSLETLKWKET